MTNKEELREKIAKLNVYKCTSHSTTREGISFETLQRFQKSWEEQVMHLIDEQTRAARLDGATEALENIACSFDRAYRDTGAAEAKRTAKVIRMYGAQLSKDKDNHDS